MAKAKFVYTGIGVRDLDRSIDFYTKKMGMRLLGRHRIKETDGEIADLKSPNGTQTLELNWYAERNEYRNGDEVDHLAFRVQDVDKYLTKLKAQGVEVAMEPFNEGRCRLAYIKDPDGIWIELECPKKE